VPVFKHFWQNLIQRFKPRVYPPAGEFEQELSAARQEREGLLGQLTGLQAEVERGLSAASQEQQSLLGHLNDLRAEVKQELSAAGLERQALSGELAGLRSEVERGLHVTREAQQGLHGQLTGLQSEVEHGLSAVREEQHVLLGRLTSLQAEYERELSAARLEKQALLGQVSGLQDDLEHISSRDEQLRIELQQRFEQIRGERDAANQELVALRGLLTDAGTRQQAADARVHSLEILLNEQRQEHDVALQQTFIRERRLGRRLTAAMTIAAAAFVLGVVGGAINFWQVKNSTRLLGEVSQGIRDIKATIAGQSSADVHAPSLRNTPAVSENGDTSHLSGLSPDEPASTPPKRGNPPDSVGLRLPEPDFIASKSLPAGDYRFKRREDASAFLRENAKQPGVVTLPSGLQYRELIPGTGKQPGTDDKVVIEYRAFRPDGTETENSFNEDVPKALAVKEAFPGLKEALLHMREGAQWELYIPARLAYQNVRKRGPYGYEPRILTVELVSVVPADDASQP
jgi:predicted  nucleic acid-binding Zn-ribbon protein